MRRGFDADSARSRRGRRGAFCRVATAWVAAAVAGAGCAAPGSDVHLAPLWTRAHTADAGLEYEAAGGFWRHRRNAENGRLEELTIGPLYGIRLEDPPESGEWTAHFLVPLGYARGRGGEARSWLFPLYIWQRRQEADGSTTRQTIALPGLIAIKNDAHGNQYAWFPVFGNLHDFIVWEQFTFVLFPLYLRGDLAGNVSTHLLWPFFGYSHGGGRTSWRFWPLYGTARKDDRYERWFFLWPIYHYQRNFLGGGGEEPETAWMLWPLMGKKSRGTYRAYSWLWPFLGYAHDPRSGFWALDFPWPLVRIQRGPDDVRRTRFWPLYGYLRAGGLVSRTYLWPLIHVREEDSPDARRESLYVVPFWQSADRRDKLTGTTSSWRKLFPLFQHEREDRWRRTSFPTLDPFWRNELVDRYFAWIWKVYEWQSQGEIYRARSWLGLYRRERGMDEDRRSLSGLWASRRYEDGGRRVKETSILFGLLRWRVTEGKGLDMLRPAFPGPGWPAFGGGADG